MPALKYMLDSDMTSYVMKATIPAVMQRLGTTAVGEVCISVITKGEILFGAVVSPRRTAIEEALEDFLRHAKVMEFPEEAAQDYAEIRAELKKRGALIGSNDMLIAAHARALDLILVTNNVREYHRVPGLRIENWSNPHAVLPPIH